MSTGSTIGGIAGIVIGVLLIGGGLGGSRLFVSKDGQTAPVSGEGAKWILIILGVVVGVGGIVALVKGGSG